MILPMGNRIQIILTIFLCLAPLCLPAQEYTQTPVTVSKEKVRGSDGKLYYSHIVQERQTLFSIASAYGVSIDEIYAANPNMNLKQDGLKKNSIILIPLKKEKTVDGENLVPHFIHIVRWFENIDDISKKYGVPAEDILRFNNLKERKLKKRMKLMIPREPLKPEKPQEEVPVKTQEEEQVQESEEDNDKTSLKEQLKEFFSWNIFTRKNKVNAVLILPFNAQSNPSDNNLDFYSGALLALNTLKSEGVSTDISVYDATGGSIPVTVERLKNSDIIIGPIAPDDINKLMLINTEGRPVVSPLDHKSATLVSIYPSLIHAPTPYNAQYEDIAHWVAKDAARGDKVIVISETSPKNSTMTEAVNSRLKDMGISFSSYSYNILEGRKAAGGLSALMTNSGANRVIVSSDSEAFVYDVVRNLNLMIHKKLDVIVYTAAKIRSFDTIEVENLHNLNLHVSSSYFIDYEKQEVKDFILKYRALYNTEPSQFAFQGYDIAYYFISTCSKYGSSWWRHLSTRERTNMLQCDFLFYEAGEGGMINQGVRRIVYERDYTIRLVE